MRWVPVDRILGRRRRRTCDRSLVAHLSIELHTSATPRRRGGRALGRWPSSSRSRTFAGGLARLAARVALAAAPLPASRELLQHPLILDATAGLLEGATTFHVHLTQTIAIGGGEPAQPIHRDQWAFDFFPFPEGYDVQLNTIWALTDFTEANGATRVVPGSNHGDVDRLGAFDAADTVPAEMSRGSVLVYSGSVHHGGGANTTDDTRIGINLTYARSWLRQEENQYLSVPLEVARTLDDDLLRLLGYARGAYALGYVDDGRDPLDVVRDRTGTFRFGAD